jgi:hypothetical protein
MRTTKIYDIGNSVLMGLDVLGTIMELKSENPVTIGGRAQKRYRQYVRSFVPEDYEPTLHPDLRVKRYFQAQGLELAPINVYAGWIATFFSWVLLPILQPINLYRWMQLRWLKRAQPDQLSQENQHVAGSL